MIGHIYKITNIVNNKIYIGQTIQSIEKRFIQHKSHAKTGKSHHKLANALRKYGDENFFIENIEDCEQELLDEREKYWINFYNSLQEGYNTVDGGQTNKNFYQIDNIDEIIKYYYECHNQQEVCKKFNITDYKFRQYLVANNLPTDFTNYGKHTKRKVHIYELNLDFDSEKECAEFLFNNNFSKCKNINSVIVRLSKNLLLYNKTYGLSIYFSDIAYEDFEKKYFDYIRNNSNKKIICKTDENKNILKKYESIAAATKDIGGGAIQDAVKNRNNTHYSKGYYWYYEDDLK